MLTLKFLYTVIDKNDHHSLFNVRDDFFVGKDKEYVSFSQDFFATHGKLPDRTTIQDKFNIQLIHNNEKADYWRDELIKAYQTRVIEKAVVDAATDTTKAIEIFQDSINEYNIDIGGSVASFSNAGDRLKKYKEKKATGGITHLSTGNSSVDIFSAGYRRSDLWTLGGHEGAGKTWMLLRMAAWLDFMLLDLGITDRPILIVSGEMDADEITERLDAIKCQIAYDRLTRGNLDRGEEWRYKRYLKNVESNIKIVDNFDSLKDVAYYINIYKPCMVYIDGSHLFASSYEWTEITKVTSGMKKMSRNNKVPIFNTTHLKADKGKSSDGGSIDDFAYTKGYTRDSDIVGVMFADDMMEVEKKFGIDWVKIRRGSRIQMIWQNDYEKSTAELIATKTGSQIGVKTGNSRNQGQASALYQKP